MNATIGPSVLELRQTRELTAHEKRDLSILWMKLVWRSGMGALYSLCYCLWFGFGAFLALSIFMAARKLWPTEPTLAGQLAISALGFAVCMFATRWLNERLYHSKRWTERRSGDHYVLSTDGVRASTARGELSCDWSHIETIINNDRQLIAVLHGYVGLFVVKAAFEGQDADRFGTELVRRWQEHRAKSSKE